MQSHVGDSSPSGSDSGELISTVMDLTEEFGVALIEIVRERPSVFGALLAAVLGAVAGTMLADRMRPKRKVSLPEMPNGDLLAGLRDMAMAAATSQAVKRGSRVASRAQKTGRAAAETATRRGSKLQGSLGKMGDFADLAGLASGLLENPLVRGYLISMVAKRLRSK